MTELHDVISEMKKVHNMLLPLIDYPHDSLQNGTNNAVSIAAENVKSFIVEKLARSPEILAVSFPEVFELVSFQHTNQAVARNDAQSNMIVSNLGMGIGSTIAWSIGGPGLLAAVAIGACAQSKVTDSFNSIREKL